MQENSKLHKICSKRVGVCGNVAEVWYLVCIVNRIPAET